SHMLEAWSKHGLMDLAVDAQGDVEVDQHHTVEDVGIVLGQALRQALGDKKGIVRYGLASIPMDEALVSSTVDLSGRPFLVFSVPVTRARVSNFDRDLLQAFFRAFALNGEMTRHVTMLDGTRPFLGICLGYQLLFSTSEEFGEGRGLDVVPGAVRRLPPGPKIPHMGWNRVEHAGDLKLFDGIPPATRFYFVHSFYPVVA